MVLVADKSWSFFSTCHSASHYNLQKATVPFSLRSSMSVGHWLHKVLWSEKLNSDLSAAILRIFHRLQSAHMYYHKQLALYLRIHLLLHFHTLVICTVIICQYGTMSTTF